MSSYDLVIRNARVATASDTFDCDIGVRNGKITALAAQIGEGRETIDAGGRWVLPGGIDSHVHIDEPPFYGVYNADDFEAGTRSCACGGTTTMIPFAQQEHGETLRSVINSYHSKAEGKAMIDYAFHTILLDPNEQVLGQEIPALIRDGYTSYKVYMTYDGMALNDRQILATLDMAKREGGMVMIHAENDDCIHYLHAKLEHEHGTGLENYPKMAPSPVEREAAHRAITLGEVVDTPILIVHVSAHEAMEQIRWAQDRGLKVYGETCPQYLFIDDSKFSLPGWEGAKYLCAPTPRHKGNQDEVWRGIANGVFQVISSDHCSFLFDSDQGKKIGGGDEPHFRQVPPGVPGVETRMPLLFSEGFKKGRIDINRFVALMSTNAAKIYGLYPRKGTIAVGSDADIVIWDEDRRVTITAERLHDNMDYTPYEGMEVTGWPDIVVSRGEVIVRGDEVLAKPGRGEFLRCDARERPA